MQVHKDLGLLVRQQLEAGGEDHEVGEESVEVSLQAQADHLPIVGVVDVGQHVEEVAVDLAHHVLEA